MLGANPFVGFDARQIAGALARLVTRARRPRLRALRATARVLESIASGTSTLEPAPKDRRFSHPAFAGHPIYRRVMQLYLAACAGASRRVDDADLDWKARERARFAVSLIADAISPTNTLLGNPEALERAWRTRGKSLVRGAAAFIEDVRTNGAMPRQVDVGKLGVGRELACSPGAVVFRNDVLEVIQYGPLAGRVHARPLLVVPPQINKFYVLDLAQDRSFIELAARSELQPFAISWRNPTAAQRDWDLGTYVGAARSAIDAVRTICGCDDVNIVAACAGGITTAALLGHLAATGARPVHAVTFLVTVLDTESQSTVASFVTEQTVAAAIRRSRLAGVLDGRDMARVFAWLRPNDLVWSYWVNNYLLGNAPPSFDILHWNADTTRLPAALHADFALMMLDNPLVRPGGLEVLGTPIDLGRVDVDAYIVAGTSDHITPWRSCHRTVQLLGGRSEFVLSTSGHIQAVVNPPGTRGARFHVGGDVSADPDTWLATSIRHEGSWWPHWATWMKARSGSMRDAPSRLGCPQHPAMEPAPGRYVLVD